MAIVSEIAKLKPKELKKVQGIVAMFHLLGMTDKDIECLVEVAKNWNTMVSNMNSFTEELVNIKRKIKLGADGKEEDDGDSLNGYQSMYGFESNAELIIPKGAKKK